MEGGGEGICLKITVNKRASGDNTILCTCNVVAHKK